MEPTLRNRQTVFVSSVPYFFSKPKKDDIVLFEYEKKKFLKRVKEIKEGKYYLIGDNKNDSLDSKKLGWIERQEILGKVMLSL